MSVGDVRGKFVQPMRQDGAETPALPRNDNGPGIRMPQAQVDDTREMVMARGGSERCRWMKIDGRSFSGLEVERVRERMSGEQRRPNLPGASLKLKRTSELKERRSVLLMKLTSRG